MIKSNYLSYLLSNIKTKAYADEIISRLDDLKDNLYNKRIDLDKKMSELFSYEIKEKIKSYSWQEQVNLNDPESFGKFLAGLRMHIKNMPVVKIILAFNPGTDVVEEISGWFVENFGKNVLLNLEKDEGLIGGAVISFNQKELDFSLKKRIDEKYNLQDWQRFISQARHKAEVSNGLSHGQSANAI